MSDPVKCIDCGKTCEPPRYFDAWGRIVGDLASPSDKHDGPYCTACHGRSV